VFAEQELSGLASPTFSITCLRFATACGMSDRLRLDLVLNDFVACAVAARKIRILSDGSPWRPLIHVADMARAIEWAIQRDVNAGGPYLVVNTGSDTWNYQVSSLAEAVVAAIPGTEVSINTAAPPDKRSYRVDFSKFRALATNHQPRVDLVEAITDLRTGFDEMSFRDREFRRSQLMRLNTLVSLRERKLLTENLDWVAKTGPALVA
jgi:nucleoside-diphosphate-sugar epimerase